MGFGHGHQRRDVMHGIGRAQETIQGLLATGKRALQTGEMQLPPHRRGMHFLVGQVYVAVAHIVAGVVTDFFVAGDAPDQMHFTPSTFPLTLNASFEIIQNFQPGVINRIGVIIGPGFSHKGFASFPIQLFNLVGTGLHHVDRSFVNSHGGTGKIDLGHHLLFSVGDIDDHKIAFGDGPQADAVGRIAVGGPVPALAFTMQNAFFLQVIQQLHQRLTTEALPLTERQFKSGATYMIQQNQQLIRRDEGVLGRGPEEKFGVAHNVLVQRQTGGDQYAQRRAIAPAGPPQTLPASGDGAGIAIEHADVQRADVHPQLQRRGGNYAIDTPFAQFAFGIPPLRWQIAAPVGKNPRRPAGIFVKHILKILGKHLHHQPGLGEHNALETAADGHADDAGALGTRGSPDAEIRIHYRRIPQQQMFFPLGRSAFGNCRNLLTDQLGRQLLGIRDRRRAENKPGIRAIKTTHPAQPPDHIGHMGAEHAPIGVHLVDDHIFEIFEKLRPFGVMGQNALVQHVGIGNHDVTVHTHRLAGVPRRVAIEGVSSNTQFASLIELQNLGDLILG